MPMAAGEARRFRKTAILRTASIKRRLKEPGVRYKPQRVVRLLERRDSTTAQRREKPQTVTSMRQRMAKPTPTLGAVGSRREEVRRTVLPLPRAGGGRKRAADHQPSAEAAAEGLKPEGALLRSTGPKAPGETGVPGWQPETKKRREAGIAKKSVGTQSES